MIDGDAVKTGVMTCVLYHPARPVQCLRRALRSLTTATTCEHAVEVVVQGPVGNNVMLPKPDEFAGISLRYIHNQRNLGNALPLVQSIRRFLQSSKAWWAKCDDDMSLGSGAWDRAIEALENEQHIGKYECGCAMIAVPEEMWSGKPRLFYREQRHGRIPLLKWKIDAHARRDLGDHLKYEVCDFADHGCTVFARSVFEDGCAPDKRLFVGGVDFDLALAMLDKGYKSILVTRPRCQHHHSECKPYDYGVIRYDKASYVASSKIIEERWGVEIELLSRFEGCANFALPGNMTESREYTVHKQSIPAPKGHEKMKDLAGTNVKKRKTSRVGLWNHKYRHYHGKRKMYGDPRTAIMAAEFFNDADVRLVEDWGCGYGGFKTFLREDQIYVGVDGSATPYRDVEADLTHYGTVADGILLRHVLDHNTEWRAIVANACASFRKKLVIILFTPFSDKTKQIQAHPSAVAGTRIPDIAFCQKELMAALPNDVKRQVETVKTRSAHGQEHIIYLTRTHGQAVKYHPDGRRGDDALGADWHRYVVIGKEGWNEGQRHLVFLQEQGLCRQSRVLDVGCGPLRTGVPLIRYLEPGCYVGIDNEPLLVAAAIEHELADIELQKKHPVVRLVENFDISAWCAEKFDIAWAYSVLTHLTPGGIEECLRKVMPWLVDGGIFFASMNVGPKTVIGQEHPWRKEILQTRYTTHDIKRIAGAAGCRCARVSGPLTDAWKDKNLQNVFAFMRNS